MSGSPFVISREAAQTLSFRGRRSRNKVSVGEPAEGSLLESSYLHFNEEGWRGRSLVFVTGWLSSLLPTLGAISMVLTPDSGGERQRSSDGRREGRGRVCLAARV